VQSHQAVFSRSPMWAQRVCFVSALPSIQAICPNCERCDLTAEASVVSVSEVPGCQHLRSARSHQLSVPRVHHSTFGTLAFSVAGRTVWNSLPDHLHNPAVDSEILAVLEDVSVRQTFEALAHWRCYVIVLYKSTFTYLLTY